MDAENCRIDTLDRKILGLLLQDARMPYLEIARRLVVSGGTIHQRIQRMTKMGLIEGSRIVLNTRALGMDVLAIVGIHLTSAQGNRRVIQELLQFPEVIEAYYTTGNYALMVKICVPTIEKFHQFLSGKLQIIGDIQSTESFICLDRPIHREVQVI